MFVCVVAVEYAAIGYMPKGSHGVSFHVPRDATTLVRCVAKELLRKVVPRRNPLCKSDKLIPVRRGQLTGRVYVKEKTQGACL